MLEGSPITENGEEERAGVDYGRMGLDQELNKIIDEGQVV